MARVIEYSAANSHNLKESLFHSLVFSCVCGADRKRLPDARRYWSQHY